ncbi:MAG TPA: hypothetical protein VE988_05455 [Gemmataceae bacterium]|nr:hypothetical protein [Gemmataceae bacterium]
MIRILFFAVVAFALFGCNRREAAVQSNGQEKPNPTLTDKTTAALKTNPQHSIEFDPKSAENTLVWLLNTHAPIRNAPKENALVLQDARKAYKEQCVAIAGKEIKWLVSVRSIGADRFIEPIPVSASASDGTNGALSISNEPSMKLAKGGKIGLSISDMLPKSTGNDMDWLKNLRTGSKIVVKGKIVMQVDLGQAAKLPFNPTRHSATGPIEWNFLVHLKDCDIEPMAHD